MSTHHRMFKAITSNTNRQHYLDVYHLLDLEENSLESIKYIPSWTHIKELRQFIEDFELTVSLMDRSEGLLYNYAKGYLSDIRKNNNIIKYFKRDSKGRLITEHDVLTGDKVVLMYSKDRLARRIINGRTTAIMYDEDGSRVEETITPEGVTMSIFDNEGKALFVKNAQGTIHTSYNDRGQISKREFNRASSEEWGYNADGTTAWFKNREGLLSQYTYEDGNLIMQKGPGKYLLKRNFQKGLLVSEHDKGGTQISYKYDEDGRKISQATKEGTKRWEYENGNLVSFTDIGYTHYTWEYDSKGILTECREPESILEIYHPPTKSTTKIFLGVYSEEYTYDSKGILSVIHRTRDDHVFPLPIITH